MRSVSVVSCQLDKCSRTYGQDPCAARLGVTGSTKCYNTLATCQDLNNFDDETRLVHFCLPTPDNGEDFPAIKSIDLTPAIVSLGENLGSRASIKVKFSDFKYSDAELDPYLQVRSLAPDELGFLESYRSSGLTGAWSMGRKLLRTYTGDFYNSPAGIDTIYDQLGSNHWTQSNSSFRPTDQSSGPQGRTCAFFDGDDDYMVNAAASNFFSVGSAYVVICAMVHAFNTDDGTIFDNACLWADEDQTFGVYFKYNDGDPLFAAFNWDGDADSSEESGWAIDVPVVIEFRHDGGDIYMRINGGTWRSVASGNATGVSDLLRLANDSSSVFANISIFEMVTFSAYPGDTIADAVVENMMRWAVMPTPFDPYQQGTFFGKFRARHPYLQGRPMELIRWIADDYDNTIDVRTFRFESSEGPSPSGTFVITGKDLLKYADDDRAQVPIANSGYLADDLDESTTSINLAPSGIGDAEYEDSGYMNIGGSEVVSFTRSSDTLTITRGQLNTAASSHDAGDRAQMIFAREAYQIYDMLLELFVYYCNIDPSYLDYDNWVTEIDNYLGILLTGYITEPTAVKNILSEIIDIASLVVWWDDRNQLIKLQVLRQVSTDAETFSDEDRLEKTLEVTEQLDSRLTQVWTYFAPKNPLLNQDQIDNYRSIAISQDTDAEALYGTQAIRVRYTRWIATGGLSIATSLNEALLGRFRDPPRLFKFDLFRKYDVEQDPVIAGGYQLTGGFFQKATGEGDTVPIQITRLGPEADRWEIEAQEMRFSSFFNPDPGTRVIVLDSDLFNVNLRNIHDSLYNAPESGDVVVCVINGGVLIGSTSIGSPAFDVGDWPSGVDVQVYLNGTVQGCGGDGAGISGHVTIPATAGGVAFYTRYAVTINGDSSLIGGGGGGGLNFISSAYVGGGGGAGTLPGAGGAGSPIGFSGQPGTHSAGGVGGDGASVHGGAQGAAGVNGVILAGASGGAAIDGVSFVTIADSPTVIGSQIN